MKIKRILALLLLLLIVPGMCPISAFANNDTAAIMRIEKMQGAVSVTNYTGKKITKTKKMKLYNGYQVKTGAKSYAWISLDDTKVAKLDANSCVEVQKKNKKITLYLSCGNIFFNAKEPLKSNEDLHIKTSTLAIGVRGTSGCVTVINARVSEIDLLTGKLEIIAEHPAAGVKKTATMRAGQRAISSIDQEAMEASGEMATIRIRTLTTADVCGNCVIEIAADPTLAERIKKEAPQLNPSEIIELAEKKLAEDEATAEEKQKAIDDAVKRQDLPKDVIRKSEDKVDDSVEGEYIDNKLSEDEFSDSVDINNDVIEDDEENGNEQDDSSVSEKIVADMMDVCPPYATSFGCDEYTNGSSISFTMDGKYYMSGLTFEDSSFALFNLDGQYSEMTFDIGSTSDTGDHTVIFTVDDVVVKEITVDGSRSPKTVMIPLNCGRQLRIDVFSEVLLSKCGLGNIMIK